MSGQQVVTFLIAACAITFVVGISVWTDGFAWFGHLPGDLFIQRASARVLVPFTSVVLLSIACTSGLRIMLSVARRAF